MEVHRQMGVADYVAPKVNVKAAKKDISGVIKNTLSRLEVDVLRAHADVLQGKSGGAVVQIQARMEGAQKELGRLQRDYASQDSQEVQQWLLKGEIHLARLQQFVSDMQVFGTANAQQVLQTKREIVDLLQKANSRPKQAASHLVEAQKKLNALKGIPADSVLGKEVKALQDRIGYQAQRQLQLSSSETKLLNKYNQDQNLVQGRTDRYQSLVEKTYAMRFITGREGVGWNEWTNVQGIGIKLGDSVKTFSSLKSGAELALPPQEGAKGAVSLTKEIDRLRKECFRNTAAVRDRQEELVQNPSDREREKVEAGLHKQIDASQESLERIDTQLAFKLSSGKYSSAKVKKLETKRAEIMAHITSLQASREVFRRQKDVQKAIAGLEQNGEIQQLFSTLRKVRKSPDKQLKAGETGTAAHGALGKLVDIRGADYVLVKTLKQKFAQIAADALSKTMLKEAKKWKVGGERYRRFVSVLSVQVTAYEYATGDLRTQIERNIALMQAAKDKNSGLQKDADVTRLMEKFERLKSPPVVAATEKTAVRRPPPALPSRGGQQPPPPSVIGEPPPPPGWVKR